MNARHARDFLRNLVPVIEQLYRAARTDVKRVSNEALEPLIQRSEVSDQRSIWRSVKKVPNRRFQGSVTGEMDFGDFPFRLWRSRK